MAQWSTGGLQVMEDDDGYYSSGGANTDYADAEQINYTIIANRGYRVVSGCEVTAQSTPDLTVQIGSGSVFIDGTEYTVSTIASLDLSSHVPGTSGESRYVIISADGAMASSSDFNTTDDTITLGSPATTGNQLRPVIPEDHVILAEILLTNGMSSIGDNSIADIRQFVTNGEFFNGNSLFPDDTQLQFGDDLDIKMEFESANSVWEMETAAGKYAIAVDSTTGHIGIGALPNDNIGVLIDAPAENVNSNQSVDRFKVDDQGALTVGNGTTSPLITSAHFMEPNIVLAGSGAVTTATTIYSKGPPTEATNNYSIFSDAGDIRFDASQFILNDENDSDETLFDVDLLNRTFTVGATDGNDDVESRFFGNIGFNTTDIEAWRGDWGIIEANNTALFFRNDNNEEGQIGFVSNMWLQETPDNWALKKYNGGTYPHPATVDIGFQDQFRVRFGSSTDTYTADDDTVIPVDGLVFDYSSPASPTFDVFNATQTGIMNLYGNLDLNGNDITNASDISIGTSSLYDSNLVVVSSDNNILSLRRSTWTTDDRWRYLVGGVSPNESLTIQFFDDSAGTGSNVITFNHNNGSPIITMGGDLNLNANNLYSTDVSTRIAIGDSILNRIGVRYKTTMTDDNADVYGEELIMTHNPSTEVSINNFYARFTQAEFDGAGLTLPNLYSHYIDTPVLTGSTTTAYGIFINDINIGSNNYAIRTNTGIVYLGDDLRFENKGSGDDPILNSNSSLQRLTLTGNLYPTSGVTLGGGDFNANGQNYLTSGGGIGNNASVLTFGTGATGTATFGGSVIVGDDLSIDGFLSFSATNSGGPTLIISQQDLVPDGDNTRFLGGDASSTGINDRGWAEIYHHGLTSLSSKKFKTEIDYVSSGGLEMVNNLKPTIFKRKKREHKEIGFILEDIQPLVEENMNYRYLISYADDDKDHSNPSGIRINSFIPMLVLSVQELSEKVNQLKSEIEILKSH